MEPYFEITLAAVGVALVVLALGWRMTARRRAAARVRAALSDPDPATRLAALRVAGQRGLSDFADILVERTRLETDERVRNTLADIIASNQWEPAVTQELVDLRLWAEGQRPATVGARHIASEAAFRDAEGPGPAERSQPSGVPPQPGSVSAFDDHNSPGGGAPGRSAAYDSARPSQFDRPEPLRPAASASQGRPGGEEAHSFDRGITSGNADEEVLREMGLMISGSALTGINVPPRSRMSDSPGAGRPGDSGGGAPVGGRREDVTGTSAFANSPPFVSPETPPVAPPSSFSSAPPTPAGYQISPPAVGGGPAYGPSIYGSPSGQGAPGPGPQQPVGHPQPQPKIEFRPQPPGPVIIVTGAGGPAGVSVIRALTDLGYHVVGADPDSLSAGLRLAGEPAVLPNADDHSFVERLCELAARTGAKAVIPTVAEELLALAQGRPMLDQAGLMAWVPPPDAVLACIDKWKFAQQTAAAGIPIPTTNLGTANGVPGSWVVKPRFGRGSRDVYFVTRPEELEWAMQRVPEPIVQTRLSGWEFTVDVLVDARGMLVGAVPRWRLETKAGISTRGRTFANDQLVVGVARLVTALGLVGAANVQGFMGPDGKFVFVEANPRFSGGLPLSLAAGADFVGEYVRGILGEPIRPDRLTFRPGVTMIRYFQEIFE